jgi:hypothetical protein
MQQHQWSELAIGTGNPHGRQVAKACSSSRTRVCIRLYIAEQFCTSGLAKSDHTRCVHHTFRTLFTVLQCFLENPLHIA